MLICPQCEFSNPVSNKFCYRCGISLIEKKCHECGSVVPFDTVKCHNCNAVTGTVRWAIVCSGGGPGACPRGARRDCASPHDPSNSNHLTNIPPESDFSGTVENPSVTGDKEPVRYPTTRPAEDDDYLDPQHRYQLISPLRITDESATESEAMVLDRQPLQISLLSALEILSGEEDSRPLDVGIPKMAQIYWQLQSHLYEGILPKIYDAWISDSQEVVLLEDRSDWQLLADWWGDRPLPLDQILFVLDSLVELWEILASFACRQSLLLISNLVLDEYLVLGLKRIYWEPVNSQITLPNLGKLWERLFEQSQETQDGALLILTEQLTSGKIDTTEQLRSRLRAIALRREPEIERPFSNTGVESDSDINIQPPIIPSAPTRLQTSGQPQTTSQAMDDISTMVPMQLFSLEDAGLTDTGRQRDRNEDAFCIYTQIERFETKMGRAIHATGLYILCDGMGGHAGSEVASALAVDILRNYFQTHWIQTPDLHAQLPPVDRLREAVLEANQAIYDLNQQHGRNGTGRMGTTLVLVLIQDTNVAIIHVGDSRLYKFTRKQGLTQVTRDHDVAQREIQRGVAPEIAYSRSDAYQLTQALGPRNSDFIKPDIQFLDINEDLLLILSSDGLTDNDLVEQYANTHLEPLISSRASLERGVNELIDLANEYNGHDNITTVLIRAKVRPNLCSFREQQSC
ncbi:MAG: serine/threonine phosphatase [Hormoscilla sp. SP5CHS1]|nr:serine/threonine phosphatase [Hormoscilla sp. SP12CHS1]MBC6454980.1 serine/threonine phosphatase [Hormoscilla sp. SP5CHS1]